jgi:hypothetical protein
MVLIESSLAATAEASGLQNDAQVSTAEQYK